jgi:hypothetical protein
MYNKYDDLLEISQVSGSHSGDCEEFYLLEHNSV